MKQKIVVHIKKHVYGTQRLEMEQLKDDDVKPILLIKEQNARLEWADISDKSRELKILWAQWTFLQQETLYRVLRFEDGQTSIYMLWFKVPCFSSIAEHS